MSVLTRAADLMSNSFWTFKNQQIFQVNTFEKRWAFNEV
jgi:hypothetical protein